MPAGLLAGLHGSAEGGRGGGGLAGAASWGGAVGGAWDGLRRRLMAWGGPGGGSIGAGEADWEAEAARRRKLGEAEAGVVVEHKEEAGEGADRAGLGQSSAAPTRSASQPSEAPSQGRRRHARRLLRVFGVDEGDEVRHCCAPARPHPRLFPPSR